MFQSLGVRVIFGLQAHRSGFGVWRSGLTSIGDLETLEKPRVVAGHRQGEHKRERYGASGSGFRL